MLAMAETVWLQLGPTMRKLYGQDAAGHDRPRAIG